MTEYFKKLTDIIISSLESIDENVFNQLLSDARRALEKGHKIIVSGLGKNVPICDKFVGTMISLGLNANFLHTNSAIHGDLGMVKEGDLVIILTKSGETQESIYLAELLEKRNVNLWLLSFSHDSTLARKIANKLIVDLEHEGDMWDIVPNNSTTLNLIILQALAMELSKSLNISLEQFKKNHPGGHIGDILQNEGR